jgi:hypothetical protein
MRDNLIGDVYIRNGAKAHDRRRIESTSSIFVQTQCIASLRRITRRIRVAQTHRRFEKAVSKRREFRQEWHAGSKQSSAMDDNVSADDVFAAE